MADGSRPDAHGASIADAAGTNAIIDAIYALIRAPEGLNELVARIAEWIGADMALASSPALPGCRPVPLAPYKMDFTAVMNEPELLMRPEFTLRAMATGHTPGVFLFEDLMSAEERTDSPYWQKIMAPLGIASGILTVIRTGQDNSQPLVLNLFRSASRPPFSVAHVAAMEDLLPHLRRAFGILLDAPQTPPETSAQQQAHAAIDTPVFYFDDQARVIYLNSAAQELIGAEDGLALTDGTLSLSDPTADGELNAALRRVIGGQWTTHFRAGAEVLAPRSSGARPLLLVATPMAASNPIATVSAPVRCVLFAFGEREDATLLGRVQRLYGLTAAEAEIAVGLASGKSLAELAVERGTRVTTVRTQLGKILKKTDARRQSNLVSMILRLRL
jgi:DNA-binding CsgD family transcriptional regulator/PAS domain-containing protein